MTPADNPLVPRPLPGPIRPESHMTCQNTINRRHGTATCGASAAYVINGTRTPVCEDCRSRLEERSVFMTFGPLVTARGSGAGR